MSVNTNLTIESIQRYIDIKINEVQESNSSKTASDNNSNELLSNQFDLNKFKESIVSDILEKLKNSDTTYTDSNQYFAIKKDFSNISQLVQNNNTTLNNIKKEFLETSNNIKKMVENFNTTSNNIAKTQEEKIKVITSKLNELQNNIYNDISSLQNENKKNTNIINNISETSKSNNNDLQILKKSTSEKFQDIIDQINELNQSLTHLFKIEEI